jgi:hypothetical protein
VTVSALGGQLKNAENQKVEYVTILVGANDLWTNCGRRCTPSRQRRIPGGSTTSARPCRICQTMPSHLNTEADWQKVVDREKSDNQVLAD